MKSPSLETLRIIARLSLSAFYFAAAMLHLRSPDGFILIVPSFVPWPADVVWFTGWCEIVGAIGLFIPQLRKAAGIGLALYAVCVFPANINHAFNHIDVSVVPNSWWYHAPRFALQPVLVWWALFCAGVIDWPLRGRR
ncbi:MAG TPA: hypothetical protein VIJ49_00315 [Aestuariivirga sp.]